MAVLVGEELENGDRVTREVTEVGRTSRVLQNCCHVVQALVAECWRCVETHAGAQRLRHSASVSEENIDAWRTAFATQRVSQ